MSLKGTRVLTPGDLEKLINELLKDDKIIQAIEKIVKKRLARNPKGDKAWKQAVVDNTVAEILQKLNIVDMVMEEWENVAFERPAFSESEPQRRALRTRDRRRPTRTVENKATVNHDALAEVATSSDDIDLGKTQILRVTLPQAVKEMPESPQSDANGQSFPNERVSADVSGSPIEDYIISRDTSFLESPSGQNRYDKDEKEVVNGSDEMELQRVDDDMNNDSVRYEEDNEPDDIADFGKSYSSSKDELTIDVGDADDIEPTNGHHKDESISPHDQEMNESEEREYTEEDWETEEPPAKQVKFVEPLVSDLFLSRYKFERDEIGDLFYSAEEGNQFQRDFDRELERSGNADKGWLEWMMERSDEEAKQHEEEDQHFFQQFHNEYEVENSQSDDEEYLQDQYF